MATNAFAAIYLDEFIRGFELHQSLLRNTVTTAAMINGLTATFLVTSTGGRAAVTRGFDGLIPAAVDDLVQQTVTLVEMHDLVRRPNFNIFASQASSQIRTIMQLNGATVMNHEIDQNLLTTLSAATIAANAAAQQISKELINVALTKLFNANVQNDGNIWGVISPAAWMRFTDQTSFASMDYTKNNPIDRGAPDNTGSVEVRQWNNVKWIMHPGLPGVGTNSCTMYLYHRNAVGHAIDTDGIKMGVGYDEEQDYSFARHTVYHGSKILQNSGIVKILHDDSVLS